MSDPGHRLERVVAHSRDLENAGRGERFDVEGSDGAVSAFVIRWKDVAFAYVNACPHVGSELDWLPGQFFDMDRRYLLCATHGAAFEPDTGLCVSGPCVGARLTRVGVREAEGVVLAETFGAKRQE